MGTGAPEPRKGANAARTASPPHRAAPRGLLPAALAPLAAAVSLAALAPPALAAAPGAPGAVSGEIDRSSVAPSWVAATDDEGVTGYDVHRDGACLTTVRGTTHVAELADGGSSFHTVAFDTPSDGSARGYPTRSPEASFARPGAADPAPPADGPPAAPVAPCRARPLADPWPTPGRPRPNLGPTPGRPRAAFPPTARDAGRQSRRRGAANPSRAASTRRTTAGWRSRRSGAIATSCSVTPSHVPRRLAW